MAFFKFRKDSEEHSAPAPAPESVETLRKRARYRLAGAAILVLAGVIGFPVLFDNQPRPIAVNIPIDIPDKAQSRPLPAPLPAATSVASAAQGAASAVVAAAAASDASRVPAPVRQVKPPQKEEQVIAGPGSPGSKPATKEELRAELRADAKAASARGTVVQESKPAPVAAAPANNSAAKAADAAKAQALLDGKPAAADAQGVRFVVQFGSYSDPGKAHEARLKVERAGLKTYSQMVQGPDGKKYRVRVGPYEHRAEADKAVEKIKKLNFPTAVLEL